MNRAPVLAAVLLALASPARGELYRCVAADGSVRFTDDRSACPDAAKHALQKELTRTAPAPAQGPRPAGVPPASAAPGGASEGRPPAGGPEAWRHKRELAERELERRREEAERARTTLGRCNRHEILAGGEDGKARLAELCDQARETVARSTERTAEIERYLQEGLADECRAAGCLPGWIR